MIKVVLVDDHRMFRQALRVPLEAESDIEVIAEACTGAETYIVLDKALPDVLIIDIGLQDSNGIDVVRKVHKLYPSLHVVALSGHAERIYLEQMLKAGANGYVVKSAGADELIAAIRAVITGKSYLSPEMARLMVDRIRDRDVQAAAPPLSVLGKREKEVLTCLAKGKRSGEIASELGISPGTVDVHRRNIKQKLGLHTVAELTSYAIYEGLISSQYKPLA